MQSTNDGPCIQSSMSYVQQIKGPAHHAPPSTLWPWPYLVQASGFRFPVYGLRFTVWPYLVDIAKVQDARGVYHNVGIVTGLQAVAARNLRWHNAVPPSEG